jgi:aspartate aminotransferase
MKNRIAQRLQQFDSSIFREVFVHQQILTDPIDLSVGTPEHETHEKIKAAGIKAIQDGNTGYTPANGISQLRHALCNKLYKENGIMVPANQVSIVPGLTTGLLLVYMAILDPGDELITIDPGYPPYDQLARALGVEVMSVLTLPTFQLDLPTIEASITDKTKAIVINTPNNPTGAVYPEKDLRKLAEIADKNNILIISDEIYEHYVYDGSHFSIGSIYPDTISMYGFSKQYSMTGWRLGYIAGPYDVIEAINELQQYSIFSSSAIAQHAALEAIKIKYDLVGAYKQKRDLVVKTLEDEGIKVWGAQGSYYVFFKAPNNMTDLELSEKFLDHQLVTVPGRAFSSRHGYIRISYGTDMKTLKEGMKRLKVVLSMVK